MKSPKHPASLGDLPRQAALLQEGKRAQKLMKAVSFSFSS
jgi:hypothetical protein